MMRNALISHLYAMPRKVYDFRPVTFLADESRENLLSKAVPDGVDCPNWLNVCPMFEADVRVFHFDQQEPFVGLCLNVFTRRRISRTCKELLADGFDIQGYYVGRQVLSTDSRIQPRFRLAGRVDRIDAERLILSDHRDNEDNVAPDEVQIEAAAFEPLVRHALGDLAGATLERLRGLLENFYTGPSRFERLRATCKYFSDRRLEVAPGVGCHTGSFLSQDNGRNFPRIDKAPSVAYVFDPSGGKTDTWHDRGMENFGPYSAPTFTPTRPRICVVCQRNHKGRVEQFIRKFLRGISIPGSNRSPFAKGLIRKYALEDATTDFYESDGPTAHAYQKAVYRAAAAQSEQNFRYDLALVETEERFHELRGSNSPYLVTKAEFMSLQIPVQEFEIETTEIPDSRLQYVLNNMALATYAKLGGVPWLVRAHLPIAHELVVGMGSAQITEGRLGETQRVVGITTVFSGDGNYCLSTLSRAVRFEDYADELLVSLKNTIERLSKNMGWQPKEHVRLVFHAFKPLKEAEEEAVKALIASLGDYDVEYAFLHVVEEHPLLLFDQSQEGEPAYDGKNGMKGVYAPERGRFLRLSGHEILMTLTGPKDVKQVSDGMPRPVILRLGRGSTFNDMTYLTRQVNTFACHSWRSYFPSPLPVTIQYSELIARLLGNLSTVPQWNPIHLVGRIGEGRWFL
ncbi:argonaute/piwi family protein [Pirellula sp. SH-Sr6A]|uniref:argonaute/piwi family protein n=1 Tax=Pirellula sp. SH-Sr6A TaxID=1632865 RepID=UPI0011BA97C2|nr:Piwi domain-containing protein [Pirellula sp. SH-Sr6A]